MVLMSVEPGCTCWNGLAEFACLKGILLDSHMPKRVSLIPALLRQARSQTYRFADGVQSFFGTGRITRGIDVEERYCFLPGEPLGKGSFGEVRAALDKYARERNAVKCATAKGSQKEKEDMVESFVQEAHVHLKLDHPNITKLLHVYVNEGYCHLVMELCSGGELYDRWFDRGVFTEDEAIIALRQMLRALTYLHWHNVCHRDLKLENWVYKDHSDLSLKLIDFGFAKAFTEDTPMTATLGTIYYIAPEVIKGSYNQKCDIWSTGIILYMLLAGEPPYYDTHCDDWTMQKILHEPLDVHGEIWDSISPDCKDFVFLALDRDVKKRPSAKDLSKHAWLRDGSDSATSAEISKKVLQDLRDFGSMNVIKRAAFGLIAISMAGTDDLRDLEVEFRKLDREGSGTILKSRLADAFMKQLSMTETEAQALFKKLDLSGDEEIEYSEFIAAANGSRYMCNEALIKQAFQSLDVDGSGAISIENLRQVFGDKFNGTTVEEILAQVDKDRNGSISYEEFVQAIMELRPDEKRGDCNPEDLRKRISHAYEFTSVGRRHRGQGQKMNFQKAGIVYKASQRFQRARASHGQPPALLGRGWHTPDISRHCSREFSLDNAHYADSPDHRGLRPPTLNRGWHTPDISRHPSRDFSVEQL